MLFDHNSEKSIIVSTPRASTAERAAALPLLEKTKPSRQDFVINVSPTTRIVMGNLTNNFNILLEYNLHGRCDGSVEKVWSVECGVLCGEAYEIFVKVNVTAAAAFSGSEEPTLE